MTRALVQRALGWDDLQFGQFQFDKGIEYLQGYCFENPELVSKYSRSEMFWKWFKNHWHNRDLNFKASVKGLSPAEVEVEYRVLHDMRAFRFTPHRAVMDATIYSEVIAEANV